MREEIPASKLATAQQTNNYSSMGFLNGAALIAPFMPVSATDGFRMGALGPLGWGVNMFEEAKDLYMA